MIRETFILLLALIVFITVGAITNSFGTAFAISLLVNVTIYFVEIRPFYIEMKAKKEEDALEKILNRISIITFIFGGVFTHILLYVLLLFNIFKKEEND